VPSARCAAGEHARPGSPPHRANRRARVGREFDLRKVSVPASEAVVARELVVHERRPTWKRSKKFPSLRRSCRRCVARALAASRTAASWSTSETSGCPFRSGPADSRRRADRRRRHRSVHAVIGEHAAAPAPNPVRGCERVGGVEQSIVRTELQRVAASRDATSKPLYFTRPRRAGSVRRAPRDRESRRLQDGVDRVAQRGENGASGAVADRGRRPRRRAWFRTGSADDETPTSNAEIAWVKQAMSVMACGNAREHARRARRVRERERRRARDGRFVQADAARRDGDRRSADGGKPVDELEFRLDVRQGRGAAEEIVHAVRETPSWSAV